MDKVYVISFCQKTTKEHSEFHFKGFYKGLKVKKILVKNQLFEVGEEYLIYLLCDFVRDGVLIGESIRFKKLFG